MAQSFETLSQLLEQSAREFKDNDLFGTKQPDGSWTWLSYGNFAQLVAQCRTGLRALGVGVGDRVGIVADNRVEWATAAFASYGIGAQFVPMYPAQPPKEWEYILGDCNPKVVLAAGAAHPELQAIVARAGSTTRVIGLDLPEADEASFQALLARGTGDSALHPVTGSDIAGLVYTSGTTGNPKGVMLTHANFCTNVIASGSRFDFDQTDRALCFLPWAHSYGQTAELYTFISIGASMAINDEVPNLVDNLAVVKPTVLVAVPRIFNRIYDRVNKQMDARPALIRKLFTAAIESATAKNHGQRLSWLQNASLALANKLIFKKVRQRFGGRLRFVVSGSAALSTEVAQFIDALGIEVFEGYGLTETSPVASTNYPKNRKIGSVGKALPGVSIRIDTQVTGEEKVGEIIISGPNVMQGYYN
ncbi:MAG TPA: AMP-binding protein, partial [Polyangiaceae bacterium]|nr:AMP-binding protein [Polyangiaceae bacterium]